MIDLSTTVWRKSSYSGPTNDNCVEVADSILPLVPVRDSKAIERPALTFGVNAWSSFIGHLKNPS
ncbi:DUF397 domain-containing protein [Streptomyces iconiensis]|uniref:DUF397 domain-containing protein n=1 Tax=Streptomyces iconiensis TaxID=1384038 RepID=A0ABT7A435_9ACTN|nr:DUF397 domain-containing protein [Streptomyces iconiensis]MDJ1136095.1 DUF397 domain-containing protein [Streptomyces iconiensis]